MGMTERVSEKG